MDTLPDDRCPRCGGAFHCGMNDDRPCPCTGLTLDAALQQRLRERYNGCLCINCLRALAAAVDNAAGAAAPATCRTPS